MAATSSRPPACAAASVNAAHHASGWTSVPSGWLARPERTSAPVSASRTTTLQDWVDESTPATSGIEYLPRAEQVFHGELVQLDEPVPGRPGGIRVEVLERGPVGQQVLSGLTGGQRRLGQFGTRLAARASWTRGSARNAAARSLSSRYIRMLASAEAHTPLMSSVREGL